MTADTRRWRVGTHYGIHAYAENPGKFDDEPIFTAHERDTAEQIVFEHNAIHLHHHDADDQPADIQVGKLLYEVARLKVQIRRLEARNEDLEQRGLSQAGHLLKANGDLHNLRMRLMDLAGAESSAMHRADDAAGCDEADCV
ncbi:hypothetical protein [Amycolatopsis sp. NPDC021455]|uniref:hypothetical protein n=1 Tax=Amycolatopsis sp. NPDC021455 TaxID=3154901 RepID=UPI0033E66023